MSQNEEQEERKSENRKTAQTANARCARNVKRETRKRERTTQKCKNQMNIYRHEQGEKMKDVRVCDVTMKQFARSKAFSLSFKEKLETA